MPGATVGVRSVAGIAGLVAPTVVTGTSVEPYTRVTTASSK